MPRSGLEQSSVLIDAIPAKPVLDCMTDRAEIGARFLLSINGTGFWHVCPGTNIG